MRSKKVRYHQSGKKEQILIIGRGNAASQSIPPMVTVPLDLNLMLASIYARER